MQKHDDGSITLSAKELAELNKAYQNIYSCMSSVIDTLLDVFSQKDYLAIVKWRAQLNGEKFKKADYV